MNGVESPQSRRKACVRCATAKAKCSFSGGQKICDRCRRLRRDCILEEAPRRRKEKQSTRVKALEEKVNSLLTLLSPENGVVGNADAIVNTTTPAPTEEDDNVTTPSLTHVQSAKSTVPSTIEKSRRFDVIDNGLLTISTADTLLNNYKQVHSKFFPFVIVAPEIDATTLWKDSPFLFLAIMTTCLEGDHMLQRRLGVEAKKILCERVLISNERDIDLLQGLLIQLSWNHFHFNPINQQSYMLLQMAIGLVMDLNLDRCPAHRDQRVGSNLCYKPSKISQGRTLPTQCRRTTAEIRALLGCFYLSSSMAMMRKELAMKHTKWIDHCCHVLEVEQESATDAYVTAFINARCLVQRIGERFSYDDHTFIRFQSDTVIQMSLNGFKKEVTELEASSAFSSVQENCEWTKSCSVTPRNPSPHEEVFANEDSEDALIAELKALPITIHEVALYRDWTSTSRSSSQSSHLWDLLTSTRDFLNYLLCIPSEVVKVLPSAFFTSLTYALIVLSTVARLPSTTGWDNSIVKREADVMNIGERVKAKFRDELTKTGENVSTEQRDVWTYFTRGIGGLMAWHQRCETQSEGEVEYDLPISSSGANSTLRCAVADMMTPFTALRFRKPIQMNCSVENGTQGQPTADAGSAYGGNRLDKQPDMLTEIWDDELWQSIMDEFSMFPTTVGFPAGSVGQY